MENQSSATIVEHYADALYKTGQKEKALEQWKRAKALGGASELIDKKISEKKNIMMRLFSVLICGVVLIFSSCGKKLLPTSSIEEEYALEKFDFEYLQAKSKISFSSPDKSLSSSANIRMKKDSIIWISVSPIFGIEAARGFISPRYYRFYGSGE